MLAQSRTHRFGRGRAFAPPWRGFSHVAVRPDRCTSANGTQGTEGLMVAPASLRIQRQVGQGSFGEVFEGICIDKQETHRVIMKRVKSKTAGAAQMGENEHLLNVYVQKNAPGSCAEFFGYTVVKKTDRISDKRITPGKWLLWKYEGLKTLRQYLSRKDCLTALSVDLRVPEHVVIPTVIMHLLESVKNLHAVGVVHRDLKPSNIILCEEDLRFRLIDLGAMADLRTGINYHPAESILDPYYCPPEQYVLPTDAPDLAANNKIMSLAMSAVLWSRHKPDRFDMYSVGLILLQLAMPQLRMKSGLQSFHTSFKRCRYDLMRWRTISSFTPQQSAVMDANDGAGWELAEALLRPRHVQVLSDGHVYFTNEGKQRPSAQQALQYRFIAPAFTREMDPEVYQDGRGSENWINLFNLVQNRAQMAEETSTTIQKLRYQVQQGQASEVELTKAEGVLANLTGSLNYLQSEMKVALKGARRAFRQGFGADSESETSSQLQIDISALTPSEEHEQQKRLQSSAPDQSGSGGSASPAQWSLAGAMLAGIQTMGRAVQASGDVVERINAETQAALQYRGKVLNSAEENFIDMLEQASVQPTAMWPDVADHFGSDPRFTAVREDERFIVFRSYIRMQQDSNLKLSGPEREFMRKLAERVRTSNTSWETVKQVWARESFFRAVHDSVAETLFMRHIAKLQQDEGAECQIRAAEMSYRSALESLQPPISSNCNWMDIRSRVQEEHIFAVLSVESRQALFEEVRAEAQACIKEAQARSTGCSDSVQATAAAQAAVLRSRHEEQMGFSSQSETAEFDPRDDVERQLPGQMQAVDSLDFRENDEEREILAALRAEQARLKEEYERMEKKLRDMEARLAATQDTPDQRSVASNGASMNGTSR